MANRAGEAGNQTLRLPIDQTAAERRAKQLQEFQVVLGLRARHSDAEMLIDVLGLRNAARQVDFAQAKLRAETLIGSAR